MKVSKEAVEEFVSCDAEGELGDEVADAGGDSVEEVCMKFWSKRNCKTSSSLFAS